MSYEYMGALPQGWSRRRIYSGGRRVQRPAGKIGGRMVARQGVRRVGVARGPMGYPLPMGSPMQVASGQLGELGFSLKPPKFVRKAFTAVKKAVTLKRVLIGAAAIGAAALVPGALPLLAKGAVGVGKGLLGAGRLAIRGVTGVAKFAGKEIGVAAREFTRKPAAPTDGGAPSDSTGTTDQTSGDDLVTQTTRELARRYAQRKAATGGGTAPAGSPAQTEPSTPTPTAPGPSPDLEAIRQQIAAMTSTQAGGGGGGMAPMPAAPATEEAGAEQPQPAGMGGDAMVPVLIGAAALGLFMVTQSRGRRR